MKESIQTQPFFRFPLLFVVLWISLNFGNAQDIAFPDAKGWAATTTGGRGGKIIKVTTLEPEGKGSFLEAVQTKGRRIIVFEVAGIIDLKGKIIDISDPYLTIAGQTAPSPGITFIDGGITIQTHDVIVQHIRIRTGASRHEVGWEPDGMATNRAYNVIIDHCTFTWAVDENCSASGPRFEGNTPDEWRKNTSRSITISNNIIAEGLSKATHPKGEHSKGTLIHDNATDILIYGNLYANNVERNVRFKGGSRGVQANNLIYNPGRGVIHYSIVPSEWGDRPYQTGKLSIVGNHLILGPSSSPNLPLVRAGEGPCELYMHDNLAFNNDGTPTQLYQGDDSKIVKSKPIWHETVAPLPASEVKEYVLKNAGARPWDRDFHDQRIIDQVKNNQGKIIHYETEVGGYPSLSPTRQKFKKSEWDLRYMTRK